MEVNDIPYDMTDIPLYNSRIIDNYIKLINKKYANIDVADLMNFADMTPFEVADQGHWFTQDQINRFHEKLAEMTQNPNIAREAGRYAASPDAIGFIRSYIMGMVDPASAYRMINRAAKKLTRSTRYESRKLSDNRMEIVVTPEKGVEERSFQCENRIGLFESVTMSFIDKLPVIDHPECVFTGGECCRYLVSWESSFTDTWKKLRVGFALVAPILAMLLAKTYPSLGLMNVLLSTAIFFLLISLVCEYFEKGELKKSVNHLLDSTDALLEQIDVNYNKSILTNEIGRAINTKTNLEEILAKVPKVLENRLDFDRGVILLSDLEKKRLIIRAGFGYTKDIRKLVRKTSFSLNNPYSKGVFVSAFHQQKSYIINNIDHIQDDLSPKSSDFAKKVRSKSFICCPIVCDGESIGILAVDNIKSKRSLVQSDLVLLKGIASVLGVSIRNAELIEAKERQFNSLIRVLGASIDARDPMTMGHSEKVTEYAMGICDELRMEPNYKEAVRVAALLHDYGKIGVPDAVLKKPGRLTRKEVDTVQTHALKTKQILEEIRFEGIYKAVPEIAGSHHEKVDGSGYPLGLKGEEINMGARIIAVADFFDAITSKRHYRDPMEDQEAIEALMSQSGRHFDTAVVNAFIVYFKKAYPESFKPRALSA